jgi:hypothetical protein
MFINAKCSIHSQTRNLQLTTISEIQTFLANGELQNCKHFGAQGNFSKFEKGH